MSERRLRLLLIDYLEIGDRTSFFVQFPTGMTLVSRSMNDTQCKLELTISHPDFAPVAEGCPTPETTIASLNAEWNAKAPKIEQEVMCG